MFKAIANWWMQWQFQRGFAEALKENARRAEIYSLVYVNYRVCEAERQSDVSRWKFSQLHRNALRIVELTQADADWCANERKYRL